MNALGILPAMLLLVDFIARGLRQGPVVGAYVWVLYGLAAIVGPPVCGWCSDRVGPGRTYRGALLLQALSLVVLALSSQVASTLLPAVVIGGLTPGIVPIVLGRLHELLPADHAGQRTAWSRATIGFALFQMLGGYGFAFLFTESGENYALVFLAGALALALALVADFPIHSRQVAKE